VGAGILLFYTRQFQVSENFQDKRTAGSFYWKKSVSNNSRFRRLKESKNRLFRVFEKKSVSKNGQFQVFETKNQFQRTTRFHERTGKDLAV